MRRPARAKSLKMLLCCRISGHFKGYNLPPADPNLSAQLEQAQAFVEEGRRKVSFEFRCPGPSPNSRPTTRRRDGRQIRAVMLNMRPFEFFHTCKSAPSVLVFSLRWWVPGTTQSRTSPVDELLLSNRSLSRIISTRTTGRKKIVRAKFIDAMHPAVYRGRRRGVHCKRYRLCQSSNMYFHNATLPWGDPHECSPRRRTLMHWVPPFIPDLDAPLPGRHLTSSLFFRLVSSNRG